MTRGFPLWRLALSSVAGLALAFAFPAYNFLLLGWVAVAGLLFAVLGARPIHAALCGFLFDVAFYAFSIPWVSTVLQQYGPIPFWLAAGVFALLVVAMSLFGAAFAAAVAWMAQRSVSLALLAAPFLWVAVELARTQLPQQTVCFFWNLLGYTAAGNLALVQLASLTGVWGLSFLVAAYNSLFVWALRPPRAGRRAAVWLAATAVLAAIALFGGRYVPQAAPTRFANLVQTNLPQALDYPSNWNILHAADLAELGALSIVPNRSTAPAGFPRATEPGFLVWPEVPAPFSLQQPDFAARVASIAQASNSDFLFGEVDWRLKAPNLRTPYNSAALFDPEGREEFLYDKIHLVPFGEFIPWRNSLWFARRLTGLVGDFGTGTRYAVGNLPGGRFSVFICYEAIFPDGVRQFVANGAEVLINISNDGWFGRSAAAEQHLAQARVRAVENRRWLLRDTNNGFTVSVDPYGRIVARLPPDVRGRLAAPYAFRSDLTFYTRFGDWIAYLSVLASACFLIAAGLFMKKSRPATPAAGAPAGARSSRRRK